MATKLTLNGIKDATKARLDGQTYRNIADKIFGVDPRTERRWRAEGKVIFRAIHDGRRIKHPMREDVTRYFLLMGLIDRLNDDMAT